MVGNITLGLGELAAQGVCLLLYNWKRKAEFTADRAGLLACQNIDAAISTLTKLAGFPYNYYDYINSDMILKQAVDFKKMDSNKSNKAMKYISVMDSDHPWNVDRAKELKKWYDSGEYNKILNRSNFNKTKNINTNTLNTNKVTTKRTQKFCIKCGKRLKPNAKFCTYCGEKL